MRPTLITGASGIVGSCLAGYFREVCDELLLVDRVGERGDVVLLDLADREAARELLVRERPEVILHLAGNKDVFALERDPELSRRINFELTRTLCDLAAEAGLQLVFLSSDYVFDGAGGPYREDSPPHPATCYGRDKLAAERYLLETVEHGAVVRSSGLFGFSGDFVDVVRSVAGRGEEFPAFTNLSNNPTFCGDLFRMLRIVIDRRLSGVFHGCGAETLSRYEFALQIAACFGIDAALISQDQKDDIRPDRLALDNRWTYAELRYTPPTIAAVLEMNRGLWPDPG
jgi:dTDP-4-dehydrorhamnose reductase